MNNFENITPSTSPENDLLPALKKEDIENSHSLEVSVEADFTQTLSEIEKITSNFSKSIKSEVVLMSTIEKKSISKIKAKLISYAS